ncbi:MAG TPA: GNAT family N-acetyltransferase [Chloroflexia bacterium]|nr:GNAT family N-acetyltransferase [Chloroflexia bacterium]
MLRPLGKDDYFRILPLLEGHPPSYFPIVARAIVQGNTRGRFWVDDALKPSKLLMWDDGPILGLCGDASDSTFNGELSELLGQTVAPQALAHGNSGFKIYYTPDWEGYLSAIFPESSLQKRDRSIYGFGELRIKDWNSNIPDGSSIRRIDSALLESNDLVNLDRVTEEIACCWTSVDQFLDKGFGFCVISGDIIAGWCTAEYASDTDIGIGIETVEEYQGRGFGTLVACAFIEHCLSKGLKPYWDCWKSNLPSSALAEKVGFRKLGDYPVFVGRFVAA